VKLLALLCGGARSGRFEGGEGGKSGGEGEGKAGRVRVMLDIDRIMAGVEMDAGVGDGGDGRMS
jgi:hypothetical protein